MSEFEVDYILDELVSKLREVKGGAEAWRRKENTRRNQLALEAASNNLDDAQSILSMDVYLMAEKLHERYEHTKYWEAQFRKKGGFDNGYAEFCHREAKDAYHRAYISLMDVRKMIESK